MSARPATARNEAANASTSSSPADGWTGWLPQRRHRSVPDLPADVMHRELDASRRGQSANWSIQPRSRTKSQEQQRDAAFLQMVDYFQIRVVHTDYDFGSLQAKPRASFVEEDSGSRHHGNQYACERRDPLCHRRHDMITHEAGRVAVSSEPRQRPERKEPPPPTATQDSAQMARGKNTLQRGPPRVMKRKWKRLRRWFGFGQHELSGA